MFSKASFREGIADIRMIESPKALKPIATELGWRIFLRFSRPSCPIDVAKSMGLHEQKVYYYVRRFRDANLIREVGREQRHGTTARFYQATGSFFGIRTESQTAAKSLVVPETMEPFVSKGRLRSNIIVGSPDPHGPFKMRASDSCCAIDLALFIGSLCSAVKTPNYRLDVEVRPHELRENLIVIGGPTVNMVTRKLNQQLPIYIDMKGEIRIRSGVSGRVYSDDECGLVAVTGNPWKKGKSVMVLAGKRFPGTRGAVLACTRHMDRILAGNRFDKKIIARVVRGHDMDGDGVVDSVDFLE